ncbi:hypothetical protein Tco_0969835 [Tanacetum coccineum]
MDAIKLNTMRDQPCQLPKLVPCCCAYGIAMKQGFLGLGWKVGGREIDKSKDNRASSLSVVKMKEVDDSDTGKLSDVGALGYQMIEGGPTSYAKLVTIESSRKSVNFRILLAPARNGADVAISLESV